MSRPRTPRPKADPKQNRERVDEKWKSRVKDELVKRGWSYERLADEIGKSRSGVYKLLDTNQRSGAAVPLIQALLNIGAAFVPNDAEDPLRRRFNELASALTDDEVRAFLVLLEKRVRERT